MERILLVYDEAAPVSLKAWNSLAVSKPPWHAVRVAYSTEIDVATEAEKMGYTAYCPRYWVRWVTRGKKYEKLTPYLATYIFVRFDGTDAYAWHDIMNIKSVSHLLGGEVPMIVTEAEMAVLRAMIGDGDELVVHEIKRKRHEVGETVRIAAGPFTDMTGEIEIVEEEGLYATVKFNALLGRELSIRLPSIWCKSVGIDKPDDAHRPTKRQLARRALSR